MKLNTFAMSVACLSAIAVTALGSMASAGNDQHQVQDEVVAPAEELVRPQLRNWSDLAPVTSIRPQARPANLQFEEE